jgi:chromate transporter
MATFVGFTQAGVLGALSATLGVVLPSFVIIFLIAKLFTKFSENKHVKSVFWALKPVVVALVLSATITLLAELVLPAVNLKSFSFSLDGSNFWSLIIFAAALPFVFVKIKGKKVHPIFVVLLSAGLGVLLYGVIL